MSKTKYYLSLNAAERRLILDALLRFRNKALANGIDTVDIDQLIRKLQKRRWF
ncbi:MAG: hypothetical protein IJ412_06785 [Oscillospiraceae bacterium]|nr:hypothetical protein [Oscillospiraceae bacterium]